MYNLDGGILAWQKAGKPTTTVETDVFATQTDGGLVKIHALLHASICIEHDGRVIYVDPVTQLRGRTVDYSAIPKADIILVTHEHPDHYDTAALRQLTTDKTQLIMNPRCVELYGSGQAMKNGDRQPLAGGGALEAVPAYNTTAEHLQFHPKGRDNGYILTLGGLRLYIAGDTEDIPEMADIKDIDIAFLPCNQPFTMTTEQLVNAAKMVNPKVLFPYHYGETDITTIPAQLPGIDVRIRHYE
ncbi:MAG: MBL fold metallo-hydrolase [Bacteroidales bacterium]|nr:MBL fold metallo-hydrolase [Bacteroidales bacterium]